MWEHGAGWEKGAGQGRFFVPALILEEKLEAAFLYSVQRFIYCIFPLKKIRERKRIRKL